MANLPASPFFPRWTERLVLMNYGFGIKLLTVKKVEASDISAQHNSFLLPRDVVENKIISYLRDDEREKSNLINFNERRSDSEPSSSSSTRNYDGLNVSAYVEGGWRFELLLTYDAESGNTFVRGNELELLRRFGNFREGDNAAIWIFRHFADGNDESKLCFCFVKIDSALMIAESSAFDLRLAVL